MQKVEVLTANLKKLDQMSERVESGQLIPQELESVRKETQLILEELPAEDRAVYKRLQEARRGNSAVTYHAVDLAPADLNITQEDIRNTTGLSHETRAADDSREPARAPGYKAVSPF